MSTDTIQKDILRGGQFLVKETNCEDVFTLEDLSEEQKMMRDSTKEFVDRELWAHWERFENKDYGFTEETMRKAGELGLLGIAVPEAYGGLGMGFVSTMLVCDYISGATGSFSTAFGAHTGIGTMPITLYGNEDQKNKYVPKLATGEWFGAYCLTEPGAGSDANSGKTGIHSSSTRQVFFSNTKVPVENMLSERGNGFKIAMNALNVGRIKLAAACLDAQRRVISESVKYANERLQFKTPIINFGAIKSKIATMATNVYAGESASYRAAKNIEDRIAKRIAEGNSHQEAELKGVEEYAIECSILKVAVSEHCQSTTDEGIQIFGGMGFSADTPMESAWRDSRISRIYEGTNEINRMLAVGMLIKKAMKGHVDMLGPATAVGEELMGIPSMESVDFSTLFAEEKDLLARLKKVFLMVAGSAVQKFGPELDKHQQLLMAASDILIEIYVAESAILRTEKNVKRSSEKEQETQIAMSRLYLYNAVDTVIQKGKEAIVSFAEGDEQRMMLMGLKRFSKYTNMPNVAALRTQIADKISADNGYTFD